MIEEMLADFFGVEIALGTVSNTEQRMSAALRGPLEEAAEAVQGRNVLDYMTAACESSLRGARAPSLLAVA